MTTSTAKFKDGLVDLPTLLRASIAPGLIAISALKGEHIGLYIVKYGSGRRLFKISEYAFCGARLNEGGGCDLYLRKNFYRVWVDDATPEKVAGILRTFSRGQPRHASIEAINALIKVIEQDHLKMPVRRGIEYCEGWLLGPKGPAREEPND